MVGVVRRLRNSDRDDVVEISRHVWEGHDYLPSVVDEWLRDLKSYFYGVEVGGRVVAVGRLRLLEGGRIGWMEGLRVHPDFRGRGFANDITRFMVRKGESLGVERLRYTTSDENAASLKLAEKAGFSTVLRMAVCWYHKLRRFPMLAGYPVIRKQKPEKICELLKAGPRILPHGMLLYEWKALEFNRSNIEEVGKTHSFYAALKSKKLDSFSISSSGAESDEEFWGCTVYAVDSSGFVAQFSRNVALGLKHGLGSVACTFETRFEKALDGMGLKSEDDHGTHLVLLEKKMHPQKQ